MLQCLPKFIPRTHSVFVSKETCGTAVSAKPLLAEKTGQALALALCGKSTPTECGPSLDSRL